MTSDVSLMHSDLRQTILLLQLCGLLFRPVVMTELVSSDSIERWCMENGVMQYHSIASEDLIHSVQPDANRSAGREFC